MNELGMAVIAARCTKTRQLFGVSYKQVVPGEWLAYWAFPLSETTSQKEGYDQTILSGITKFDPKYPGCPHCGSTGHIQCGNCKHLSCWNPSITFFVCPWCGSSSSSFGSGGIRDLSGSNDL